MLNLFSINSLEVFTFWDSTCKMHIFYMEPLEGCLVLENMTCSLYCHVSRIRDISCVKKSQAWLRNMGMMAVETQSLPVEKCSSSAVCSALPE